MIQIKRVYDPQREDDGFRILVDRLWPRGLTKAKANIDHWYKNIAPSHELRKRFHNGTLSWDLFKEEYLTQLSDKKDLIHQLREWELDHGNITLLYTVKNTERNHAQLIKDFLG